MTRLFQRADVLKIVVETLNRKPVPTGYSGRKQIAYSSDLLTDWYQTRGSGIYVSVPEYPTTQLRRLFISIS